MTYTVQHVKMRGRLWSMSVWSPIFLSSVSFHTLPAGGPSRYSTSNVQSTCWAGPPRVLHQSSAGRSGVFIALHKHGGGKESLAIIFIIIMIIFLSWYFVLFVFFNVSFSFFREPQRNSRSGPNPSEAFRFLVEERIVCQQSQKAKYTQRVDYIIQLPVPMDQAVNTGAVVTCLHHTVALQPCSQ